MSGLLVLLFAFSGTLSACERETEQETTPEEARKFQETVMALLGTADAAGKVVADTTTAIADGRSSHTMELYVQAKHAAETWESVRVDLYRLRPSASELENALDFLTVAARYREDAFRAILAWVDSRETSEVVKYRERMERSNELMVAGLGKMTLFLAEIGALTDDE